MKFHFPSFLFGYAAGAASVLLADRLRPLLVELGTAAFQLADRVAQRVAMAGENAEDLLAEARARARRPRRGARRAASPARKRA